MPTINKNALKQLLDTASVSTVARRIAELRLEYSECTHLLNHFLKKVSNEPRIHPRMLPTQNSGRWSTVDPPLTNFPKKCINPECPPERHRKTNDCWSMRDLILPDPGELWIEFDLNAVEARIFALLFHWQERLDEFTHDYDIHTPVCCQLFKLPQCSNRVDPHSAPEDEAWRQAIKWQGKDDKRRTIGKNLTFGGQYFYIAYDPSRSRVRRPLRYHEGLIYNPEFVLTIPDIDTYGLEREELIELAHQFVISTTAIQVKRAHMMADIQRRRVARSLYGFRRIFFTSSQETAKEGFNHVVQSTVVDFINETAIQLAQTYPDSHLIHNAHDNLKWAFPWSGQESEAHTYLQAVKALVERPLEYDSVSVPITGTFKVIYPQDSCAP